MDHEQPYLIERRIGECRTEEGKRLLSRLYKYEDMFGEPKARFWDLRVNYVVGEWFHAGKPDISVIRDAGFGFIEEGSTNYGPSATPEFYNVRLHIQCLAERGNVTMEEMEAVRMNSYERDLLIDRLDDAALIANFEYCLHQCVPMLRIVATTYDEAVIHRLAPELMRRYKAVMQQKSYETRLAAVEHLPPHQREVD